MSAKPGNVEITSNQERTVTGPRIIINCGDRVSSNQEKISKMQKSIYKEG